ncbi:ribonuclease E inhibitor RraB [Aestuariibacter sp. A3R04]|uniref:ribonuclease E inhibitor RraB n=1 Tax=Aestuariibacter sp. A3R04 TaxID=2841571 RepID=UPI001C0A3401|nr:ribonuclease E inhibitor RraB [Aestuariibacter sp. A3R04]MBU3023406.1 ribonuclease E inhibitor RraB [Aestuariibacter sp. A3R04]
MRLIPLALASLLLSGCASDNTTQVEPIQVEPSQNAAGEASQATAVEEPKANAVVDDKSGKVRYVMEGYLTKDELREQFAKIKESGIDLTKPYKWEFRFTAKVMSTLEDFTQTAHMLEFWPVALESSVNGDMYWLYIQKTQIYDEELFVDEISKLMNMAEYWKIRTFDGFSVDYPDTTSEDQ